MGGSLASGSGDETIRLWHPASGQLPAHAHEPYRERVGCGLQQRWAGSLASGSGDETIKLWDPASGQLPRTLKGHTNACGA